MSLRALAGPGGRATAGFYICLFAAFGAHLPFWPLWLTAWGLTEAQAGALLGLAIVARLLAGVMAPWLADATGRRRTALALMTGSAAALFAAHALADSRAVLVALTLTSAGALAGAMPIGDALASAAARQHGFRYAQMRALGSASFLAANLACGAAVAIWGAQAALYWVVASLTLTTWFALRHPGGARPLEERARLGDALRLARGRVFLLAAVATASAQAAHGPFYAYGALLWRAQGLDEATIGALWALGVGVEVALMFSLGGWLIARVGPTGAFALAGLVGAARWAAMALEPSSGALWFWQVTHGLSFAPAHLGMIAFVSAYAPDRLAASAQGLIGAGFGGVAMALATFAAAAVWPIHPAGVYWIGFGLTVIGLLATAALAALSRGETMRGA